LSNNYIIEGGSKLEQDIALLSKHDPFTK